jgi:hypothetical protein
MARGIHGLPKVSLEPTMPNLSMPCGRPPLKRPYSPFRVGRPTTPWNPHAIRLCRGQEPVKTDLARHEDVRSTTTLQADSMMSTPLEMEAA